MKKKIAQWCVITMVAASAIFAATNPMVGGHEMFPTKNIVETQSVPKITPRWWPQ